MATTKLSVHVQGRFEGFGQVDVIVRVCWPAGTSARSTFTSPTLVTTMPDADAGAHAPIAKNEQSQYASSSTTLPSSSSAPSSAHEAAIFDESAPTDDTTPSCTPALLAPFATRAVGVVSSPYKQKFGIPRQPGLAPAAVSTIEMLPPYVHPTPHHAPCVE